MDKGVRIMKSLVISYLITGGFLLILALLLYRFQLSENVVSVSIIVIYVCASFMSGMYSGKYMEHRRFLWGALSGSAYFLILLGISMIVDQNAEHMMQEAVTVFPLCMGAGMLGGMLA